MKILAMLFIGLFIVAPTVFAEEMRHGIKTGVDCEKRIRLSATEQQADDGSRASQKEDEDSVRVR